MLDVAQIAAATVLPMRSGWSDPSVVVGMIAAAGTLALSLALLLAYKKTNALSRAQNELQARQNQLTDEFHKWQVDQANPEMQIGGLWLKKYPSTPGFNLGGRLYNPGGVEIHLVRIRIWLDLMTSMRAEEDFRTLVATTRLIAPHGYLELERPVVNTTAAKDAGYWPTEVFVEIFYVAGGRPKEWRGVCAVGEAFEDNRRQLLPSADP